MGNYSKGVGIEDVVKYAKSEYAGDYETQGKLVKYCIGQIKKNYGDEIQTVQTEFGDYNAVVTAFPSEGEIYSYWELYDGFIWVANGLERMDREYSNSVLLFCSDPNFNRPIILSILGK